MVKDR